MDVAVVVLLVLAVIAWYYLNLRKPKRTDPVEISK